MCGLTTHNGGVMLDYFIERKLHVGKPAGCKGW